VSKVILIAGDFGKGVNGRLHEGHRDHIRKASLLGDFLIIITHTDESIFQRKGYVPDPLATRIQRLTDALSENRVSGLVALSLDKDGTVTKTLEHYCPMIFAKGGSRTPDNMPLSEVEVCKELGIEIRYGIGDLLGSSREIAKKGQQ